MQTTTRGKSHGLINCDGCEVASADSATDALSAPLAAQALEKTQIPKYHSKGGHGFAAEDANNFADRIRGKRAEIVGTSNELNGADRIVDGVSVQSKYFQTATKTVADAFDSSSGFYRYPGQVLEVPKDQYECCLELIRKRIAQGKVPGFSNPADAEKIVKQGTVTYRQARNIARAGNIDSLVFDIKTQALTCACVLAISFAVNFAQGRWSGENTKDAMRGALGAAFATGGTTLISGVASAQLLRTRAAAIGAVTMRKGMKAVSHTNLGRQAIHRIAAGSLGRPVYGGAAINHVSKLLRSNTITAIATTAVITTPDFYRAAFDGSISWRQFTKNLSVNSAGVVGGVGGWMGGAAVGGIAGSPVPVIGTAVGVVAGGIVGALGGGVLGSIAARAAADRIVEDDWKRLVKVLQDAIKELASEYMLTEDEVEHIASTVRKTVNRKWLRRMFKETRGASDEALREFVRLEFEPKFETLIQKRPKIALPTDEQLEEETLRLVETLTADTDQEERWPDVALVTHSEKRRVYPPARSPVCPGVERCGLSAAWSDPGLGPG